MFGTIDFTGFAGAAVMMAMRYGVARGIFSNEAGLGTAGIAQAAGQTRNPVESGLVGMMGTFIDTIIVCTMTGLALIVTGVWDSGLKGAELTSAGFTAAFPGFGGAFLAVALAIFAYTTILGWAYYGEKCWEYLVGTSVEKPYRVLWTAFVLVGAVMQPDFVWLVADTLNALMAIPNLVVDPVMVAKSGDRLLAEEAVAAVRRDLLPLARVATPNIPEAEVLIGAPIRTVERPRAKAARTPTVPSSPLGVKRSVGPTSAS